MNIGKTIKKLRKQKDMTQEQLAEALNISPQAVSRWEINSTLPDITLIPALANIFDVSADILLGIDVSAKEKRIKEILDEAWESSKKGHYKKEMEILRAGLKEFPNDYRIMNTFMSKGIEASETIKIGEKILDGCTNDAIRHNTIRALCSAYAETGELTKAKELSNTTPFITECWEFIMENIGSEQEKAQKTRDNILTLAHFMAFKISSINSPPDDYDNLYTLQEKIVLREKIIKMTECLAEGEKYAFFADRAAWAYLDIGEYYTELNDYDKALENLKLAADNVIFIDRECDPEGDKYNPDRTYTSLLLRGMKYSQINCTVSMAENYSMQLLNCLNKESFDQIRANADFVELIEKLKKYAKTR